MTNIIQFPTSHTEVLGPYSYDTPITPEFLMEFCDDYQLETVEEFMSVFMRALDGVSIDDDDDDEEDEYTVADPIPVELSTYLHNTIYPKLVVEFLEENGIRCDEDLEEFSQMIHVLTAEPNVPLLVMN